MSNKLNNNQLTILFMPQGGYGSMNNCIGIGYQLKKMGHQCIFIIESSWKGKLLKYDFIEKIVDVSEKSSSSKSGKAKEYWDDIMSNLIVEFRKTPFIQLKTLVHPLWKATVDTVKFTHRKLTRIIEEVNPDIIVEDNGIIFPALIKNKQIPFVRIVSCNPLEIREEENLVPPLFSGLPSNDQSQWEDFKNEYKNNCMDIWTKFNHWIKKQGAPSLPQLEFIHTSKYLNFYIYPEIIDYNHNRTLSPLWTRLDSCVRSTDTENENFQIPAQFQNSQVIYVSLGTLGYNDTDLMKRLIDLFGTFTKYNFILSLGSKSYDYTDIPKNIYAHEHLSQTLVIPLVDLVITHGGNNTVCESLHFGKPMIILPLFWDQHDNAQRLHEFGYGVHLDTYNFTDQQMLKSIEDLINNQVLKDQLKLISQSIQNRNGLQLAAEKIQECARKRKLESQ